MVCGLYNHKKELVFWPELVVHFPQGILIHVCVMENSETVDKCVSYMRGERKSQYTIKEYRSMAAMFLKFSQKKLKDTNPEDIERFKHHLLL